MSYGSFSRYITLLTSVNTDKITANFENGILEIDISKSSDIKPKKITISTKKAIEDRKNSK